MAVIPHGGFSLHLFGTGQDHIIDDRFHKSIEPEKGSGFQCHIFPGTAQRVFGGTQTVFAVFGLIVFVKIPGDAPGGKSLPCGMAVPRLRIHPGQSKSPGFFACFYRILLIESGGDFFPDTVKNGVFLHQIPVQDHLQRPVVIGAFQRAFGIPERFIIPAQDLFGDFRRREGKTEKFPGKFFIPGGIEKGKIFAQLIPCKRSLFAVPPGTFPDLGIIADGRNFFGGVKSNIHEIPQFQCLSGRSFGNDGKKFGHSGFRPFCRTAPGKDHIVFIPENIVGTPQFIARRTGVTGIQRGIMETVQTGDGSIVIPVAQKDQILFQPPHPGEIRICGNGESRTGLCLDCTAHLFRQTAVTCRNGDHGGRLAIFHQSRLDIEFPLHIPQSTGDLPGICHRLGKLFFRNFHFHRMDFKFRRGGGVAVKIKQNLWAPGRNRRLCHADRQRNLGKRLGRKTDLHVCAVHIFPGEGFCIRSNTDEPGIGRESENTDDACFRFGVRIPDCNDIFSVDLHHLRGSVLFTINPPWKCNGIPRLLCSKILLKQDLRPKPQHRRKHAQQRKNDFHYAITPFKFKIQQQKSGGTIA